jgi:WD40 repeat protein
MSETGGSSPANPYVGPRPFQTGERLYGRDRERAELRDLLIAQRIVVLYAPSGAGKTSLIQAALVPELEQIDFHVLPVIRVNQPLANGVDHGANRYLRSALLSLDSALPPSDQCGAKDLAAMTLSDYVAVRPRPTGAASSDVFIFDQFEEILTLDPTDLEAKRAFFAEVGQLLRNEERWAIFSLREDHLAALDPFLPAIPTRLSTPFRLDLLGPEAARLAMQQPALNAGASFTDDAAQRLVDDLRRVRLQQPDSSAQERLGPYIEPVQLQVVCQRLWEHVGESNGQIDSQLVELYGNVDGALRDYFAESVKAVAAETGVPERNIRAWFDEKLITEQGIRGQVLWEPGQSAGLDDRAVNALVDRHLVRRESRRGALWFELAHDRLIAPVQSDNDAWYQVNLSALQQQAELWHSQGRVSGYLLTGEALEQAEQWAAAHPNVLSDIDRAFLTDSQEQRTLQAAERREQELIVAQRIAEEAQARQRAEEAARLEAERRVADQKAATRRSRILTVVAAAAAVVAVVFLLRARDSTDRAESLLYAQQAVGERGTVAGVLLSVEAMNNDHTPEAMRALLDVVSQAPRASRIWADPAATLEAGAGQIRSAALFVDSASYPQRLVAGDETGKVTLWELSDPDLNTQASVKTSRNVWAGAVHGIAFPPGPLPIAVAGDGGVVLLDPSNLTQRNRVSRERATSVAFMPTAKGYVFGNADGNVTRYADDPLTRTTLDDATGRSGGAVTAVAASTQDWVAAGREDGTVQLWDAAGRVIPLAPAPPASGDTSGEVATQPASITYLTFDLTGNRLAAGDSQGMVWLWDLDLGSRSATTDTPLRQGEDPIVSVAYWQVGAAMTVVDVGGQVVLWDIEQAKPIKEDSLHPGTRSVAIPPQGGAPVASGGVDGKVYLWTQVWTVFSPKDPFALETGPLSAAAFTDGEQLLAGGQDGTVQGCDRTTVPISCQVVATELGRISNLAQSHDGQLLASADDKGVIALQTLEGNREVHPLSAGLRVTSLTFSADNQRLIAAVEVPPEGTGGSAAGQIKVWDLSALPNTPTEIPAPASGPTMIESLEAKSIGVIRSLVVDRQEERVAIAAGGDGITWQLGDNTSVEQPTGRAQKTRSLAFSPDGSQLASGRSDGWIYLWETENNSTQSATGLGRLRAPVIALVWLDAQTLVAVGADGLVVEFSLRPEFLISQACWVAGRDFTPEESRQLFHEDAYQACNRSAPWALFALRGN